MLEGELVETLDADYDGAFGQAVSDAAGGSNQGLGGGGAGGGEVVATGTPEEIAKIEKSYTGKYVKKYL